MSNPRFRQSFGALRSESKSDASVDSWAVGENAGWAGIWRILGKVFVRGTVDANDLPCDECHDKGTGRLIEGCIKDVRPVQLGAHLLLRIFELLPRQDGYSSKVVPGKSSMPTLLCDSKLIIFV